MASTRKIVRNSFTMENRRTCTQFLKFHFSLDFVKRLDNIHRQWCYRRKKTLVLMMASQENMSNVKPHPCSEVSFIYKRTDIKYIVIYSTVNLILTTVSWCAQILQLWNTFYMKRETINILWTACSRLECTNNTNESSQRIANLCSMSFIIRAPPLATYVLVIHCMYWSRMLLCLEISYSLL